MRTKTLYYLEMAHACQERIEAGKAGGLAIGYNQMIYRRDLAKAQQYQELYQQTLRYRPEGSHDLPRQLRR
ncbi:MAG: hypothetical protein ABID87_05570 [Chloroflexota bacterium]